MQTNHVKIINTAMAHRRSNKGGTLREWMREHDCESRAAKPRRVPPDELENYPKKSYEKFPKPMIISAEPRLPFIRSTGGESSIYFW